MTTETTSSRACDACGRPIAPDGAIIFGLAGEELGRLHMGCFTEGVVWAAKQARAEASNPPHVVEGG